MASRISDAVSDARPALESMRASASTLVSDATYFDESSSKMVELRQGLDSKFDKDRLESMKHIIAVRGG
jgi:hypothetical protein